MLAELSFWQTVAAGALQVIFTALLVAGIAAFVVKRYELEHQTRAALRETYADLLVAQRRSREASLALADAGGRGNSSSLAESATSALARHSYQFCMWYAPLGGCHDRRATSSSARTGWSAASHTCAARRV